MRAEITNIFHLSSHDGYGARTTLFFKGCSLRCAWCHNPETISSKREIMWKRELCIGCGECMEICPQEALHLDSETNFIDRSKCVACGKCVEVCPSKAMHFSSKTYTIEDVVNVIRKDKPLFQAMNGGVTFSGGEPALQYKFITEVIDMLDDPTIKYALDTCGQAPFEAYEKLLPKMDQILFDIKEIDDSKHREFTGNGNELILSNLAKIVESIEQQELNTKIWIRTPLIPNYTATRENIEAIAKHLNSLIIERWDICCFNNLCIDKYRQLGQSWALQDSDLFTSNEAAKYLEIAKSSAPSLDIRLTGLRKRE